MYKTKLEKMNRSIRLLSEEAERIQAIQSGRLLKMVRQYGNIIEDLEMILDKSDSNLSKQIREFVEVRMHELYVQNLNAPELNPIGRVIPHQIGEIEWSPMSARAGLSQWS